MCRAHTALSAGRPTPRSVWVATGVAPLQGLCSACSRVRLGCNRRYDISLREERDLAYERLKRICQSGLLSITDFRCACCCSRPSLCPSRPPAP